jgi:hypothetical protein
MNDRRAERISVDRIANREHVPDLSGRTRARSALSLSLSLPLAPLLRSHYRAPPFWIPHYIILLNPSADPDVRLLLRKRARAALEFTGDYPPPPVPLRSAPLLPFFFSFSSLFLGIIERMRASRRYASLALREIASSCGRIIYQVQRNVIRYFAGANRGNVSIHRILIDLSPAREFSYFRALRAMGIIPGNHTCSCFIAARMRTSIRKTKDERRTTRGRGGGRRRISRDARFRNNRDFSIYPPKQTLRCSVTSDKTDASRRISDTRGRSSRSQIITRYDAARARARTRARVLIARAILSAAFVRAP